MRRAIKRETRINPEDIVYNEKFLLREVRKGKNSKKLTIIGEGENLIVNDEGKILQCNEKWKIPDKSEYFFLKGEILDFYFSNEFYDEEIEKELAEIIKQIQEYNDCDIIMTLIGVGKVGEVFLEMAAKYIEKPIRIATIGLSEEFRQKVIGDSWAMRPLNFLEKRMYQKKYPDGEAIYEGINRHRWIDFSPVIQSVSEGRKEGGMLLEHVKKKILQSGGKRLIELCNVEYSIPQSLLPLDEAMKYFMH